MAKRTKNPHAVALGRMGGRVKSDRKTAAARANARKPRPGRRPDRAAVDRLSAALDRLCADRLREVGASLDN